MPHPLYLKVMKATIWQYRSLSPEKKQQFEAEAKKKLVELQENDFDAYVELTEAPVPGDTEYDPTGGN